MKFSEIFPLYKLLKFEKNVGEEFFIRTYVLVFNKGRLELKFQSSSSDRQKPKKQVYLNLCSEQMKLSKKYCDKNCALIQSMQG